MLVLLIEDEPELRELTQTALEAAEMLVVSAKDGESALRLVARIKPDVIVTDLMMPVLDGFGFIERYRDLREQEAPVIAVSAFEPYLRRARELGVAAALSKPYSIDELVDTIRSVAVSGRVPSDEPPATWTASTDGVEARRLRAVLDLRLDEPAPEQRLHDFVAEVAQHFDVPIALVSVVDADLQYWTAGSGLPPDDLGRTHAIPRSHSFCAHAVAARSALVVQDSSRNPFFRDNPLVKNRGFRFYAGVPLMSRHGDAVGTLCLLDRKPKRFTHFDLELLSLFGNRVLCALEWREKRAKPNAPESAFRYLQYYDDRLGAYGKAAFERLCVVEAARAAEARRRLACVVMAVPHRRLGAVVEALVRVRPKTIVGRLGHSRLGWLVPGVSAAEARQLALDATGSDATAEAAALDGSIGAIPSILGDVESALGDAGLA